MSATNSFISKYGKDFGGRGLRVNNTTGSGANKRPYPTHWFQSHIPPADDNPMSKQSMKTIGIDI